MHVPYALREQVYLFSSKIGYLLKEDNENSQVLQSRDT